MKNFILNLKELLGGHKATEGNDRKGMPHTCVSLGSVNKLNEQLVLMSDKLSLLHEQMETVLREVSLKWKDGNFEKMKGKIESCQQQVLEISQQYKDLADKTQQICNLLEKYKK